MTSGFSDLFHAPQRVLCRLPDHVFKAAKPRAWTRVSPLGLLTEVARDAALAAKHPFAQSGSSRRAAANFGAIAIALRTCHDAVIEKFLSKISNVVD